MEQKPINERIRENELMIIDETGAKLGMMKKFDGINLAKERGYDLVLIAPGGAGRPAIAKIMDFGKFLYEQKLKEKQNRKNQTVIKVKEVKVRPQIGDHDLD
jgi:translation initiation factor IF-3